MLKLCKRLAIVSRERPPKALNICMGPRSGAYRRLRRRWRRTRRRAGDITGGIASAIECGGAVSRASDTIACRLVWDPTAFSTAGRVRPIAGRNGRELAQQYEGRET